MFCLRKHISGYNAGIGSVVGNNANLAGTCRKINLHFFPQHHLCQRDIHIAGSDNFLHGLYGFCTESHGCNGLGTTGTVDLGDTGDVQRNKRHGINRRGGTGADFTDSGHFCRHCTHECR